MGILITRRVALKDIDPAVTLHVDQSGNTLSVIILMLTIVYQKYVKVEK